MVPKSPGTYYSAEVPPPLEPPGIPLPRLPVAILVSQGRALPASVRAFLEVLGV